VLLLSQFCVSGGHYLLQFIKASAERSNHLILRFVGGTVWRRKPVARLGVDTCL
jgi:hypothetical protein